MKGGIKKITIPAAGTKQKRGWIIDDGKAVVLTALAQKGSVTVSELSQKLYGDTSPLNLARTICRVNGYRQTDKDFAQVLVVDQVVTLDTPEELLFTQKIAG